MLNMQGDSEGAILWWQINPQRFNYATEEGAGLT